MKPSHPLDRLFRLARQSQSRGEAAPEVSPEEVAFFARRVAAIWAADRLRPAASLGLWDRTGRWALATATAMVLAVAIFKSGTPDGNPFDPLIEDSVSDVFWFEPLP